MAFAFESPIGEADPYPAAGFAWDYYDMPHIPWNKLRVPAPVGRRVAADG
jgi:hypothetical protein